MGNNEYFIDNKILWHEGMLLAPQHFQMQDARFEELITYHQHNANAFYWGIKKFEIDEISLAKGSYKILELEAVMPDGTVVFYNHRNSFELQLDLTPHKDMLKSSSLVVYLAVIAKSEFSAAIQGELGRYYSTEGLIVEDNSSEGNNLQIPVLKNRLVLLAGDLPTKKYSCFPVAKVMMSGNIYQLTSFIPPTLMVDSGSKLHELGGMTAAKLRDKAYFLVNKLNKLPEPLVLEAKIQISSIVAFLPYLEVVINNQCAHPYELYKVLALIIGHVSSLGQTLIPPSLPRYDHDNPEQTFNVLLEIIAGILDEEVSESYLTLPFSHDPISNEFRIKIEKDWLTQPLIVGLQRNEGNSESNVAYWLEQSLIASESMLNTIMEKRILGLKRQIKEKDNELIASTKVSFFSLSNDAEYLKAGESLIILNPLDFDNSNTPEEIRLYVKNKPVK